MAFASRENCAAGSRTGVGSEGGGVCVVALLYCGHPDHASWVVKPGSPGVQGGTCAEAAGNCEPSQISGETMLSLRVFVMM